MNYVNLNHIMNRLHWRQYYLKLNKTLRQSSCSERLILNETPRKNIVYKMVQLKLFIFGFRNTPIFSSNNLLIIPSTIFGNAGL